MIRRAFVTCFLDVFLCNAYHDFLDLRLREPDFEFDSLIDDFGDEAWRVSMRNLELEKAIHENKATDIRVPDGTSNPKQPTTEL